MLIDAGTGVGDLSLAEMRQVDHVLLTHSHLDHIAALPLMVDAIAAHRSTPVRIHALQGTIDALKMHIFNNVIWPDFSKIPTPDAPFISFHPIGIGDQLRLAGKHIEVLPAVHTVPAVGYAVRPSGGAGHWVFTGDTERNPALWSRINQLDVAMLVIETAFSNRESDLAHRSLHLSPNALAEELEHIDCGRRFPIYVTHTKPAETDLIMEEIKCLGDLQSGSGHRVHDIRWLRAGQEFEL